MSSIHFSIFVSMFPLLQFLKYVHLFSISDVYFHVQQTKGTNLKTTFTMLYLTGLSIQKATFRRPNITKRCVTFELCSANTSKWPSERSPTQNSSVWFQTQFFHDLERIEVGNQTNAAFAIKYWAIIGKHSIFQHFRSYHFSMSVHV